MRTWDDYKAEVRRTDPQAATDLDMIEELSAIIGTIAAERNAQGISQRKLADECGIPQSSVARIESFKTTPNLDTLIKIMQPLGLQLTVSRR